MSRRLPECAGSSSRRHFTLTDPDRQLFIDLSKLLTGERRLSPALADDYIARLEAAGLGEPLGQLLAKFRQLKEGGEIGEDQIGSHLLNEQDSLRTARHIIVLWFSSALIKDFDAEKIELVFGRPEHHFQALLWGIIGAHPPALSGGYFGHWHYPPET